ncbi:hypothetical protein AHMF7605_01960 [Adhaeribacter arboris]|uniref:Uncharacterized protein n=1 Tax=Adhaeribacter arboris TaxID=2072846 RepID=A0A2T2YA39_9BACT|nr:hypothetical protein [Adhaeribacter arboris]PSR52374.1 hypothetical protein AHMF7605_01960 [Adhaeribacter arboris]
MEPELLSEAKFTSYDSKGHEITHDYGKIYEVEHSRLIIAASKNQIELILRLVDTLTPPFYILYVLVVSRLDNERGRYQSPLIETKEELKHFLLEYKLYFETDGRHHLWICTLDNSGRFIYDQHNLIFAYGQTEKYITLLDKEGFKEQNFSFPVPHAHAYNESNDRFEESILEYWDWSVYPLADDDEYE